MVKPISRRKNWIVTIIPPLILTISLIVIPISIQPSQVFNTFYFISKPYQIHATWSIENASESITITWRSKTSRISTLYYDIVSRKGGGLPYAWQKKGETQKYSFLSGWIHTVVLENLIPNNTYYFVCGAGSSADYLSDEFSFKTPALIPREINFVIGGDSRTNPDIRDSVSDLMSDYDPEFVLFTGDAIFDGHNQVLWDDWFNSMQYYWKTNNNRIIPIVPCLGNHEKNAINYFTQYALPNNERWFSIDYSAFIHIITLDTYANISGEQLTWLENDLKQHNDTLWKFVFFHEPPYCYPANLEIQKLWCPLFDTYNVSVVFNGHHHLYERSKPIRNNVSANSYLNGTMYVTSGGWGAPHEPMYPQWWTSYAELSYHFCVINISTNINNSTFSLTQIRLNNTIGDSASIIKNLTLAQQALFP